MGRHGAERVAIVEAFRDVMGREPTTVEAQLVQAVSWLETRYGTAWSSPAGRASRNRGAIQYRTPRQLGLAKPYPELSPDGRGFLYTDTSPNSDGTSTPYSVYFRRYATDAEACADLVRVVYAKRPTVLAAASKADLWGFSSEMRRTGYYEGFGATVESRVTHHYRAVVDAITRQCLELGEELPPAGHKPDGTPLPQPTIKRGSQGGAVKSWQTELSYWLFACSAYPPSGPHWERWIEECEEREADPYSLVADGNFGSMTEFATRAWQECHELKPDGVVGPKTLAAAEL